MCIKLISYKNSNFNRDERVKRKNRIKACIFLYKITRFFFERLDVALFAHNRQFDASTISLNPFFFLEKLFLNKNRYSDINLK